MKRRTFIKLGAAGTATLFLPMSFLQACQRKMASAALDSDQPVYGLTYFSGIAVYSREITTPSDLLPDINGKPLQYGSILTKTS
ncbi:MAG TPA: hypothetical protein VKA08_01260 [Balneolales bacterium]|nr:hypothetical protein [Balneolales bacterium]